MATINGTSRNDNIKGTKFDDVINGLDGNDELRGEEGNDSLYGGRGLDTLYGGIGDDILDGGRDADTMIGGVGNDTYYVDNAGDVVTEGKSEGIDTVHSTIGYKLGSNLENLRLQDAGGAIDGTGNGLDNAIWGNAFANTLSGGGGNDQIEGGDGVDTLFGEDGHDYLNGGEGGDTLVGGAGNDQLYDSNFGDMDNDTLIGGTGDDTYRIHEIGDMVIEHADAGIDTVKAYFDVYTLPDNVENLDLYGGWPAADLHGTGNDLDNEMYASTFTHHITLLGLGGDDRIYVGFGDSTLDGGDGDDYISGGFDDDVIYGGNGDDDLSGSHGTNVVYGGTGHDRLDGFFGINTLYGGEGDDEYVVRESNDLVVENANEGIDRVQAWESYTLTANVENLRLIGRDIDGTGNGLDNIIDGSGGINVLSGAGGDDELYGNQGNDVLVGGDGSDRHDGGIGADVMIGGAGNDSYLVDDIGDVVIENANEGDRDFVNSWISYTLGANVENLDLYGDAALDGTGNALDNFIGGNAGVNILTGGAGNDTFDGEGGDDTIYAGEGNDTIDGGLGADTMVGGDGDDFYYLVDDGNTIVENAGEGTDSVESRVTHTLAANVENLTLSRFGGAINGTGNTLGNVITGNDFANVLSGSGGADTLIGGGDNDQLFGGNGGDTLHGGVGDDILDGGSSHDTMIGGLGTDLLTGGVGNDTFQFDLPTEGADVITDFVSGADRFAIDNAGFGIAGTGTLAANNIAFVAGVAATSASATILFNAATHQVLWDADGTGAGAAQLLATLVGVNTMNASDFLIV